MVGILTRAKDDDGPGTDRDQGRKLCLPSKEQKWENKDPAPRVAFPPLVHHPSCGSVLALTFPLLAGSSPVVRPLRGGINKGAQQIALKI